ncbi:TPA: efflux transporter periplasmic adaptor subunit, partial [Burkholderia multivorans]|nr:efflux transporter periplasmic adaptor subunit [Burkholderia multivorans]HDR9480792.1 efflux transporter periplasmic adaptor subunit [Burkholderia multivorans]
LPNVNPAFSWVRLAQRVPVRVALDEVPDDFRMIAGRTATVAVRAPDTQHRDRAQPAAPAAPPASSTAASAAGASQ